MSFPQGVAVDNQKIGNLCLIVLISLLKSLSSAWHICASSRIRANLYPPLRSLSNNEVQSDSLVWEIK